MQRALWGGILVSAICALARTWVVLRGMAFLGDATASARSRRPESRSPRSRRQPARRGAAERGRHDRWATMALGRTPRLSQRTGLLFVGMLSLGCHHRVALAVLRGRPDRGSSSVTSPSASRTWCCWAWPAAAGAGRRVLGHRAFSPRRSTHARRTRLRQRPPPCSRRAARPAGAGHRRLLPHRGHAVVLGLLIVRRRPRCPGRAVCGGGVIGPRGAARHHLFFGALLLSWHLSTRLVRPPPGSRGGSVLPLPPGILSLLRCCFGVMLRQPNVT